VSLVSAAIVAALCGQPADAPADNVDPTDNAEKPGDEIIQVDDDGPRDPRLPDDRPGSELWREDIERRLPRSAPDALRYEPGVFVQQTAHSQGSAFIRGLTGQQTLLMFDGIRLNNSTYRQGPNQYFFTLDSQTIESIQVVRGGGSTRFGSDALGGVIMALPVETSIDRDKRGFTYEPHLRFRGATADGELGGRVQSHVTIGDSIAVLAGVGGRNVGRLESGGLIRNPQDGEVPLVPRFEDDLRTQLGTGFKELTGDARLHYRINAEHSLKLAAYAYRQFDGARTDQCPAAFAPFDECLNYDEQFRTLVYGVWEARPKTALVDKLRATLSWQWQRERRTLSRPSAQVNNIGRDNVYTVGASVSAKSRKVELAPWLTGWLSYGADTYADRIGSASWIEFTDIDSVQQRSRGQYLDDSSYTYGGSFVEASGRLWKQLTLRAGGRLSWVVAKAAADLDSGTEAVDNKWFPLVGNAGVDWRATRWLSLLGNIDHSFRAPNLDDLTSRQQTGPGFQFENPDLEPETATTFEVGARVGRRVSAEVWAFRTLIDGAVVKSPREQTDCPPNTPQCDAAWTRFQLVNAQARSEVRGLETSLYARLPHNLTGRATFSVTWGEGPNVGDPPTDPTIPFPDRVPLSRVPPVNGSAELLWKHRSGFAASSGMRWALKQSRLALADVADARIPAGGTPGFVVVDVNLTYRIDRKLLVSVNFENLFDAAYRYHGSSVNGPGRGVSLLVDLGPMWR